MVTRPKTARAPFAASLACCHTRDPEYSPTYNSTGYAFCATGDMREAETAVQKYIALVPDDPNPYDSYAELLMKMGRFDASIVQYGKALSIDDHFGGSYVGIAANHMLAGRHAAAIAEGQRYYEGARDDGERRTALFSQTVTYVDQGATDKALQSMDRSWRLSSAIGDTANMSADAVAIADILLDAGRVDAARERYQLARDLVAASSLSDDVKRDNELATHYNMARVALERRDMATAHAEAAAYLNGADARHNDVRVRQAHELNGLIAIDEKRFDRGLGELELADQLNPAVCYAMSQAYRGKGDTTRATKLAARAVNMNVLPTLPYVFIRARERERGTPHV